MSLSFRILNISGSTFGAPSARLNTVAGTAKVESATGGGALVITDARQLAASVSANTNSPDALYRISAQPGVDGNTADAQSEQAPCYQAAPSFNDKRRRGLATAVTE